MQKVSFFKCDHCGRIDEEASMMLHEPFCIANLKAKVCHTCKHNTYVYYSGTGERFSCKPMDYDNACTPRYTYHQKRECEKWEGKDANTR